MQATLLKPSLLLFCLLFVFLSVIPALGQSADRPPNILLIMTDDQGWGDVHSHGNTELDTPVLDQLAHEGVRFERFFVSPVCAPTRASLLTGRYFLRTGTHGVTRGKENMRADEVTIAEAFRDAGYATGIFGKWHNGAHYPNDPNGQGFDTFVGFSAGHWNNYFDTGLFRNGAPIETKGYINDVLTDEALAYIEANQDRPFFVYMPYNTPHSPFQVPDDYFNKYRQRGFDHKNASVYGMVENLDDNIGRLLEKLEALNLAEDTIVLFLTDNGPNGGDRYNGDMKGAKGSVHEGGVRVPLFIRWPGMLASGRVIRQLAAHIDLFPTLVELTGIAMPQTKPQDGRSLVPLLKGEEGNWPERTFFSHWSRNAGLQPIPGAVRTDRWRAVSYGENWELYDMLNDPSQYTDLAEDHPEIVSKLAETYTAWFNEVTQDGFDPIPIAIGHEERRGVRLPGHEAHLHPQAREGISYVGANGWANDWVTNWTSTEAYPFWEVDIVEDGRYEITLMYNCKEEDVGSKIKVEIAGKTLEGVVEEAFDSPYRHSPDRVYRGEVFEKDWAELRLGRVDLKAGRTQLAVKAVRIAHETVMELKAVHVWRID